MRIELANSNSRPCTGKGCTIEYKYFYDSVTNNAIKELKKQKEIYDKILNHEFLEVIDSMEMFNLLNPLVLEIHNKIRFLLSKPSKCEVTLKLDLDNLFKHRVVGVAKISKEDAEKGLHSKKLAKKYAIENLLKNLQLQVHNKESSINDFLNSEDRKILREKLTPNSPEFL